jgi:glycosyltransferase involved in cell wall biosynthesis
MTPKISVIIPAYTIETYLKKCLDSIVNQTLKDIEIICDKNQNNPLSVFS